MRARLAATLMIGAALAGCASVEPGSPKPTSLPGFAEVGYASWREDEPGYRLFPGDELDIAVASAPELSKQVTVQPDGRVNLPLIGQVMVADRSVPDAQQLLREAYGRVLLRPDVTVTTRATQPLRVFIGGEVDKPGMYDMAGAIDSLQGVIQAGGFKPTALRKQVVIIRRGPDGERMIRTVDLRDAIYGADGVDAVPLRRFDIVYVPRTRVAEAGLFVEQYFRQLNPINFGFSYALGPRTY